MGVPPLPQFRKDLTVTELNEKYIAETYYELINAGAKVESAHNRVLYIRDEFLRLQAENARLRARNKRLVDRLRRAFLGLMAVVELAQSNFCPGQQMACPEFNTCMMKFLPWEKTRSKLLSCWTKYALSGREERNENQN